MTVLITLVKLSMEAFLQFFYALEMIGRPGYPKTYIEA